MVVLASGFSCDHPAKELKPLKEVATTNAAREKSGLRTIEPSWHLYRTEFNAEDWKLSVSSRELAKRVQYDAQGKVIWEEDYYYSGREYHDSDGTGWEHLVLHYDYATAIFMLHYLGTNSVFQKMTDPFCGGTADGKAVDSVLARFLLETSSRVGGMTGSSPRGV